MRYDTCGDWDFDSDCLKVTVSNTRNDWYNFLVKIHEIIEAYLCLKRGITSQSVTDFDTSFKGKGEPGNSKKSPYRNEHKFATKIEKLVAKELGVDWKEYESAIENLSHE